MYINAKPNYFGQPKKMLTKTGFEKWDIRSSKKHPIQYEDYVCKMMDKQQQLQLVLNQKKSLMQKKIAHHQLLMKMRGMLKKDRREIVWKRKVH